MGCFYYCMFFSRLIPLVVSFLIFLVSSSNHQRFLAQGRPLVKNVSFSEMAVSEDKAFLGTQIGSNPPRCETRCNNCGHCEAIQVPTNSQVKSGGRNSSTSLSTIVYAKREDDSNYKPMSWKCKCGDSIFNP